MDFQYHPTADFGQPLKKRLGLYPREHDWTWQFWRWVGSWLGVLLVRSQFRLQVTGQQFLPTNAAPQKIAPKKVALVANHASHLDTFTILAALPAHCRKNLAVLAAEDYFFTETKKAIMAALLCQAVAFDRLHWTAVKAWYRHLQNADSHQGWALFYPSRSRKSAKLQSALLGMFLKAGWTILPVRLTGMAEAWPVDSAWWKPFKPIGAEFFKAVEPGAMSLDELMTYLETCLV